MECEGKETREDVLALMQSWQLALLKDPNWNAVIRTLNLARGKIHGRSIDQSSRAHHH